MEKTAKKKQKYCGFSSYLVEHKITKEFITDYEYWTKKIFYHWKLFTDYETFQSICWEALLSKLPEFDPEIATIQTFCLSRINNEAWRFYMKTKAKKIEIDCENPVLQSELVYKSGTNVYFLFSDFVRYAKSMDIDVDVDELYKDYSEEKQSPPVLAFVAWKQYNNED
jgi:hypothetical protein